MAQVAYLQLVGSSAPIAKAPLSILADTFLPGLERFNQLTRDMRAKGITVVGADFPDNCLVIEEEQAELLARAFAHEIRSVRTKAGTGGRIARRTATIRGIDVVWHSVLQEQEA